MESIKCACGVEDCVQSISIEDTKHLWFRDRFGKEHLFYLDENAISNLIMQLDIAFLEELGKSLDKERG